MGTNRTYLPDKNSPEGQDVIKRYKYGEAKTLARELGYRSYKCFTDAVRRVYNLYAKDVITTRQTVEEPPVIINFPPVELREYKALKVGEGDPETQVIVIGDGHAGEITPSYNSDVYKKRMNELFDSAMTITNLHRNMYPLNDLVVIDVGDNIHGENPYQGATIGTVPVGAIDQVYDIALPTIRNLLCSLRQEFKTIRFVGVRGNHGRVSLTSPRTSNWDMMLYKALAKANLPKGIEIEYSDDFKALIEIEGFRFFIFHGDQTRATMGVPYFALTRKVMSWATTYGGFPYAVSGHFHKEDFLRISSKTKLLMNGALVTDDPYALEIIGTSSIPCHWTFGVHKRYGISWLYNLVLDQAFLPEKGVK